MGMTFRGFTSGKGDEGDNEEAKKSPTPTFGEPLKAVSNVRAQAMIGAGSKIIGALQLSGQAEIDCQVEGEIDAPDTLIIGESAIVKARIHGGDVTVRGTVQGDIIATKRITLKRPAKVAGNLVAPNLVIEEGVLFEGKCSMAASQAGQQSSLSSEVRGKISTPIGTLATTKVANQ